MCSSLHFPILALEERVLAFIACIVPLMNTLKKILAQTCKELDYVNLTLASTSSGMTKVVHPSFHSVLIYRLQQSKFIPLTKMQSPPQTLLSLDFVLPSLYYAIFLHCFVFVIVCAICDQ